MRKTVYILRHDWKFGVKLILVMFVICGMSATCGAAWMWHSFVSRPVRIVRPLVTKALVTPRIRVEQDATIAQTPVQIAVQAERFTQLLNQNSKAITQLQEQVAHLSIDEKALADLEANDRVSVNRRIDINDTRNSTAIYILSGFGTLITILVGILTILEFMRKREKVPHYDVS
jgi:hypothetical protein